MSTQESGSIELWLLWKQVSELVRAAVVADVAEGSELSEAELTVLVHLNSAGGSARQNAVAASAGWDRTRLSHLLTRMESRGYLSRERLKNGVVLTMREPGAAAIAHTRPLLSAAVQRHLVGRLTAEQRVALGEILKSLQNDGRS